MDNLHNRLTSTYLLARRTKSFATARKRILRLVELQSLVAKCCKIRKIYSLAQLARLVCICITREKSYHSRQFSSKMVTFSARNTNIYNIWELRKAIFSVFYNISSPNVVILLIVRSFF